MKSEHNSKIINKKRFKKENKIKKNLNKEKDKGSLMKLNLENFK